MKTCEALLLDTRSIQKYIFAGNEIKTNIGASHLVEQIYAEKLKTVLKDIPGAIVDPWKNNDIQMKSHDNIPCEVAYVGGGNALVLFKEQGKAKEIAKALTRKLLLETPGLHTGVAIGPLRLDSDEAFFHDTNELYGQLKENQNNIVPDVNIPYTGLTLQCPLSGDAATEYDKDKGRFVSAETKTKLQSSETAKRALEEKLKEALKGKYKFPTNFGDLGQKAGDEYIAIIHIDGNDMGSKFNEAKSLANRKYLSKQVAEKSTKAFVQLLKIIIEEKENEIYKKILKEKDKILPILPIIIGGDDITFVCPGKTGIIFAKYFIEILQKEKLKIKDNLEVPFTACGGVVIVPTKSPFFRAYELTEQVCGEAKEKSRQDNDSWIDFLILHGEHSANLDQIRQAEYRAEQGTLHFGPYKIATMEEEESIERLLDGAKNFEYRKEDNKNGLSSGKVKALRDVIRKGPNEIEMFLAQLKRNSMQLPKIGGVGKDYYKAFESKLWKDGKTPYLDMIEISEFMYASYKKNENKEKKNGSY